MFINKTVGTVNTLNLVNVHGQNTSIEGDDNILGSGSMFVGAIQGSGLELAGGLYGGFMRSMNYTGYKNATLGIGDPGFIIYSGSALLSTKITASFGESYNGIGLELNAGLDRGRLRFKADGVNSIFEVIAKTFFVGDINSQFISGADNHIEISSSNFHLTPSGDVYMNGIISAIGGDIGGFHIGSSSLWSSQIFISGSPSETWAGYSSPANMFISTSKFNVKSNGDITGSNILMTGGIIKYGIIGDGVDWGILHTSNIWDKTQTFYGGNLSTTTSSITTTNVPVFAGTTKGLYRSLDGGQNWAITNTAMAPWATQFIGISGSTIFTGTANNVYYTSSNYGESWSPLNVDPVWYFNNITISGKDIYLAQNGIPVMYGADFYYKSVNGGLTWNTVRPGITNLYIRQVMVSSSVIFLANSFSNGFIATSSNNGTSFKEVFAPYVDLNGCNVLTYSGSQLFAGTYTGGILTSSDAGKNWVKANSGLPAVTLNISSIVTVGSTLYIGINDANGGVYKSTNGGTSWTAANTGLTDYTVTSLSVTADNNLYVGTHNEGVFYSSDGGMTWTQEINGLSSRAVENLGAFPTTITTTTTTTGTAGAAINVYGNEYIYQTAPAGTTAASYLYMGLSPLAGMSPFYTSVDGGVTLQVATGSGRMAITASGVYAIAQYNSKIFAGTNVGMFTSSNYGTTWTASNNFGMGAIDIQALLVLGSTLYIGTNAKSLYTASITSVDLVYTQSRIGLTVNNITSLCASTDGTKIFAGTTGGVFISTDYGRNWAASNTGLTNTNIAAIYANSSRVFAGTVYPNAGVFVSDDGGATWAASSTGIHDFYSGKATINGFDEFDGYIFGVSALDDTYAMYRSANNGTTWSNCAPAGYSNTGVCVTHIGSRLFYGGQQGMLYSDDYGATLTPPLTDARSCRAFATFTSSPSDTGGNLYVDKVIYAGTAGATGLRGNSVEWNQAFSSSIILTSLTASYLTTGSNSFIGNQQITGSVFISGSLRVTGGITGSLFGTASYAISSSRAITSSFALSASWAPGGVSSSYALTASYALNGGSGGGIGFTGSSYTTTFTTSSWGLSTPYYTQSFTHALGSDGLIISLWESSSVGYDQTQVGRIQQTDLNNLKVYVDAVPDQRFVGKIIISTGAGILISSSYALASTTSLTSISSSYALSASWAPSTTVDTSSFVQNSQTSSMTVLSSSYALTASYALNGNASINTSSFVQNSQTSSFVLNSQTSSMTVLSASYAATASYALNSGTTINTSSFVTNSQTSSMTVATSSWATSSISASYAPMPSIVGLISSSQTASLTVATSSFATSSISASVANTLQGLQAGSFVLNSQTSSMSVATASYVMPLTQSVNVLGSVNTNGFITLQGQVSNPTAPPSGYILIHAKTANGFTRMEQDNEATTNVIYGRDNVFVCKNESGVTINKGEVVYTSGVVSGTPQITKARANSTATMPAIGIAVDDIPHLSFGQIMYSGILIFNTTAFSDGDKVFVSPTTAGGLTSTRPSGTTNFVQRMGTILVSGTSGTMLVQTAPEVLNMETGTNATTWTGQIVVANTITASNIVYTSQTGSFVLNSQTGSFALSSTTSSYTTNSATASLVMNSQTSSFTVNSATASLVMNSQTSSMSVATASFVLQAVSASYAPMPSINGLVSSSQTGSFLLPASTASFVVNSQTSSFVLNSQTGSFVLNSQTGSFALSSFTSSYTTNDATASLVMNSQTGSFITTVQTASFVLNSQTSSMTVSSASYAISASYAPGGAGLSGGTTNYIPLWTSTTTQGVSALSQSNGNITSSGTLMVMGIGQSKFNDSLIIGPSSDAGATLYISGSGNKSLFEIDNYRGFETFIIDKEGNVKIDSGSLIVSASGLDLIDGYGNINNFLQINVQNINSGYNASSDLVATNNTGNDTGNYVDLGINSSTFTGSIGAKNDAYLYTTGSNLLIGNQTIGISSSIKFFSGNNASSFAMVITGSNVLLTGSLFGTSSYAATASYALNSSAISAAEDLSALIYGFRGL